MAVVTHLLRSREEGLMPLAIEITRRGIWRLICSVLRCCRDSVASHAGADFSQGGQSRTDTARNRGLNRQTLCNWVYDCNEDGLGGLDCPRGR